MSRPIAHLASLSLAPPPDEVDAGPDVVPRAVLGAERSLGR